MASEKSTLPTVRRIVTGHNPSGKSIVLQDTIQEPHYWTPGSNNAIHDLCRTEESPASIDSELSRGQWIDEITRNPDHVSQNGSVFRAFDFAPDTVTVRSQVPSALLTLSLYYYQIQPFHRTISLDYGIVTKGSIVLELDDDKRVTLNEGDTVIQRGTIHAWRNESSEWTRIYFIVLGKLFFLTVRMRK
jgi:hypothetical protein